MPSLSFPRNGEYGSELTAVFGTDIDLTESGVGVTLTTEDFGRD